MKIITNAKLELAKIKYKNNIHRARKSMTFDNGKSSMSAIKSLVNASSKSTNLINIYLVMAEYFERDDPLSPAFMNNFIEISPIPKASTFKILADKLINSANSQKKQFKKEKLIYNTVVLLTMFAEKLAGRSSEDLFTQKSITFLNNAVFESPIPVIKIFALLAMEKFSLTSKNKLILIRTGFFEKLRKYINLPSISTNRVYNSFLFCARIFLEASHLYSTDNCCQIDSNLKCVLNWRESKIRWKISEDLLEIRNDIQEFGTILSSESVSSGIWFYETILLSAGVIQIGWATSASRFKSEEGIGVGDEENSFGYDGCRRIIWKRGLKFCYGNKSWCEGDVLGCYLDLDLGKIKFYLNGVCLGKAIQIKSPGHMEHRSIEFYAAVSLTPYQHVRVNFGASEFKYPPICSYQTLNRIGVFNEDLFLRELEIKDTVFSSCQICYNSNREVTIYPCLHDSVCVNCIQKMDKCPFCRLDIKNWHSKADKTLL